MKIKQNLILLTVSSYGFITSLLFSQSPTTFVHVTSNANVAANVTEIANVLLDSKPSSIFLTTHNYSAKGTPGVRHSAKTSWYYAGDKWHLFNEDLSKMDTAVGFNVLTPGIGLSTWTVTADTNTNVSSNQVVIDHGMINGDSSAMVFVNGLYNPNGGLKGTYNKNTIGVYYNKITKKWYVFHQNKSQKMIHGSSFNIVVVGKSSGIKSVVHRSSKINTSSYSTTIDHPDANDNPDAHIFITQLWNSKTFFGTYNNHEVGVYYNVGRWHIFNEDQVKMDTGVSFNVMIFSNKSAKITNQTMSNSVHIFPNPVRLGDMLEVNLNHPYCGEYQLTVLDMSGKIISKTTTQKTETESKTTLDVNNLSKGIYFLEISSAECNTTKKFVVE